MNSHPAGDLTDLRALQAGDDTAMSRLAERWEKPLFGFAWRYVYNVADARDLATETLVRFYQHRAKFHRDSNVSAWMFTTLANLCRNHHRWRVRHPSVSVDDPLAQEQPTEIPSPSVDLEQHEILDSLAAAIDRLSPDLKEALLLYHYEHLSYGEISAVAGCSERGVETRLRRARRRLREALEVVQTESAKH